MLKTVSSADSLVLWKQNANRSNVDETQFKSGADALKEDYLAFFRGLETALQKGPVVSFVKLWKTSVDKACRGVFRKVSETGCGEERAKDVRDKFRGNLAEIFAEKILSEGLTFFKPGTYDTVDPHHEEGVDAVAVSAVSGLKVGIQVKNYATEAPAIGVFRTAGDESDKYLHTLDIEQIKLFLTHPNQYILSFTEAEPVPVESYRGRVEFLGPKWIDSLGLQGRRGEKTGRWLLFKEIADEIETPVGR